MPQVKSLKDRYTTLRYKIHQSVSATYQLLSLACSAHAASLLLVLKFAGTLKLAALSILNIQTGHSLGGHEQDY